MALGLQIGTNYVNDYADGMRGTDEVRVGPVRLVAGKLATVKQVKMAALVAFGVSGVAGLILAIRVSWWFIPIGLLCGLAGWAYTGGKHPYGYIGLGEILVFVFFGLVATAGSAYVQHVPYSPAGLPISRCCHLFHGVSPSGPGYRSVCSRRPSCRPTTCATSAPTSNRARRRLPFVSVGNGPGTST